MNDDNNKKSPRRTKRRDLIIFAMALCVIAFLARDQLLFFIKDKGSFLKYDAEYDQYLMAAERVQPMAEQIADACHRQGFCPESPEGWMRREASAESVSGGVVYAPVRDINANGEQTDSISAFTMTYDYSPGWQLYAYGGVGVELVLERRRLPAQ